jgi:hypothetical protein
MVQKAKNMVVNRYASPLTNILGWFSIGLGLTRLLAPSQACDAIGVGEHTTLMRSIGLREVSAGAGILMSEKPSYWLWSRVAGDAMDLSLLGASLKDGGGRDPSRTAWASALVAGVAALDLVAAMRQMGEERM